MLMFFFFVCFSVFIDKALANQLAQDVQDIKARLRRKKKSEREGNRMSKCSLVKAASILNMTETDLVNMLDTDEVSILGNQAYCIATETRFSNKNSSCIIIIIIAN